MGASHRLFYYAKVFYQYGLLSKPYRIPCDLIGKPVHFPAQQCFPCSDFDTIGRSKGLPRFMGSYHSDEKADAKLLIQLISLDTCVA